MNTPVHVLNEKDVVYLTNSLGELTGHKSVSEETLDWDAAASEEEYWLSYLVELNGTVGLLQLAEFGHPEDSVPVKERKNIVSE